MSRIKKVFMAGTVVVTALVAGGFSVSAASLEDRGAKSYVQEAYSYGEGEMSQRFLESGLSKSQLQRVAYGPGKTEAPSSPSTGAFWQPGKGKEPGGVGPM